MNFSTAEGSICDHLNISDIDLMLNLKQEKRNIFRFYNWEIVFIPENVQQLISQNLKN